MLVVTPSMLYGRLGAALSALIVVFCAIGLTMHMDFYTGVRRRDFYAYYTNLSNLLVLIYFSVAAPRLYAKAALRPLIPHAEFVVMMSIMLTFFVFHHLLMPPVLRRLRGAPRTSGLAVTVVSNFIVHYIVPWLVFVYWLLCSPGKERLTAADALLWTGVPLAYLLFIMLRAPLRGVIAGTKSAYPYPFLDVVRCGAVRVARTCAFLYGACALGGLCMVVFIHLLFSLFGGGHAFLLI